MPARAPAICGLCVDLRSFASEILSARSLKLSETTPPTALAACSFGNQCLPIVNANRANDFDRDGRAVMDEFSDVISACVPGELDGDLRVISVIEIPPPKF